MSRLPQSPIVGAMPDSSSVPDQVRRFIIENQPVRGHWVRLGEAWRALREHKDYPPAVRDLLGQAVCASVLLAATLKFKGTLTVQLEGKGALRLLVSQCTNDFGVRAVARFADGSPLEQTLPGIDKPLDTETFRRLVGEDGRLVVTVEAAERDMRYQGIVPLNGRTMAECLEQYFASSEQLPTRVQLAADSRDATGLLVQKLPGHEAAEESAEAAETQSAWNDAQGTVDTLGPEDLLRLPIEAVLAVNLAKQDVRLFKGVPVRFECRCNPDRVASILRALGADEVREVLKEQGAVTVTCDYCDRPYRFDAVDVERLFKAGSVPDRPTSLH